MSKDVDRLKAPIDKELKQFELLFKEQMRTNVYLLDKINFYILQRKGKQIRPMLQRCAEK